MTGTMTASAIGRAPMLAPVSLSIESGHVIGLVGPNGAGKTTLLRALAGLSTGPGTVAIDGTALADISTANRCRRLAWLPADRDVAWPMRADDLVQLGLGPGVARDDAAIAAALACTDATPFAKRRVDSLSTGERARVLLARALVARPDWLLLDEPVANLDAYHCLDIMGLLRAEATRGAGVLVSLHDLDLARRHCDRLLLMHNGSLVADGVPADVLTPENLARVFRIKETPFGLEKAPLG